jgi:hypothetical protein
MVPEESKGVGRTEKTPLNDILRIINSQLSTLNSQVSSLKTVLRLNDRAIVEP